MIQRFLALSAAAAMVAASSAAAHADVIGYSTSAPVSIMAFSLVDSSDVLNSTSGMLGESPLFMRSDATLKFVNLSSKPAVSVRFLVENGRDAQTIVDKGTFSTGISIEHGFILRGGTGSGTAATSMVQQVDFADGTSWHAGYGEQ
jgi:hypothetical protein